MKGGDAIIKSIMDQGTDVVFGYPGGQVLPLYDSLYESELKHILVRHEQTAVHAADGYARASGRVGVCIATSGPGATNILTGLATSYMDSSSVLAVVGQVPTHLIGNDAFQEVDMIGITMPITKHSYQIKDSNDIPSIVKSSYEIASTGRNGPIVIDLPKNIQEQELDFYREDRLETKGYNPVKKGNPKQIKKAIDLIKKYKNRVILSGGGVISSNASEELFKFSKIIDAPIVTTLLGKGSVDENSDSYIGMLGMHGRKVANLVVDECDCLIAVGCRFSDRTTGNIEGFAKNAKIIHIDIDPAEIGKNIEVDVPIVGDAKSILSDLVKIIKKDGIKSDETIKWMNYVNTFKNDCIPRISFDDYPLKPQQVVKEISNVLDEDSIITTDVGQNQMWMAHFYKTSKPRKFISSGGLGTMGFGFPSAIGAKVASEEDKVLAVTGDGGFLMVCQDLATIKEYDIPVVICLLNNSTLGMVSQWQKLFYNNHISETDLTVAPDFVKLAESFGINAERIEKVGETENILNNALKDGESMLLDIKVDSEELLPMVPPGCSINEIVGEYKLEVDYPGDKD